MRTAIIGLGIIGNVHKKILTDFNENIVAVCDTDTKKLEGVTAEKYSDYIKMLDEVRPDIVHICTPHYLHAQMVIEALKRDINVLCEKPLCIKTEDIDRILQAERNSKAQLGVCMQNRYNKENLFVKEYLEKNEAVSGFGYVVWHRTKEYYAQASWRGKWETEGGGALINQALHTIDLMQWFLGFPKEIKSSISNMTLTDEIEVEDTATINCTGEKSFVFFATVGSKTDFPVSINITTKNGNITVLNGRVLVDNKVYDFDTDDKKDMPFYGKICYGTGHKALIHDFYDCVRTGKKFSIDGEEASKVVKIILGVYAQNKNDIKNKRKEL